MLGSSNTCFLIRIVVCSSLLIDSETEKEKRDLLKEQESHQYAVLVRMLELHVGFPNEHRKLIPKSGDAPTRRFTRSFT